MNDTITNNASSSSQQEQQLQQQHQQHPEDSEELLVTSTSSSTTPPNNLTSNSVYPTSVIASSSTSPNSSSSSPFSNSNVPALVSTGASPTSSTAIISTIRPFNQPSETESSGGESGSPENSPPLNVNITAGASLIAISPSTSSAGFCQIVSSSTENISPSKISSLVNYDLDSEDEYDEDDEYLEEIEQQRQIEEQQEQQQQQQHLKMVNSTNTGSDSGEVCILPSSSSSSNYEKSKENPSISPQNMNTQRLSGLTTRSSRRKLETESIANSNSSHLGHRNLNILKNQIQPPSIIIKKTSSNTPSIQQNYNSALNAASTSSLNAVGAAGPSSSSSFSSTSYSSSSINLIKSDNLLNSSSNRLGNNIDNEQSQQIDNRLINNNNSNNNNSNNSNGSISCLSGVTNCINSSNNNSNNNNNCSGQNSSSNTTQSAKISIKIANKYNCINTNLESQQISIIKSKLNSNEINSSNNTNISHPSISQSTISSPSTSTLNCNNPNDPINVEQRKVEPLKINLNRHDSPIPKITIKPIIKPVENESSTINITNLINTNTSSGSTNCSSNNIPIPKLTIKQSSSNNQNENNSTTLSNIAAVTNSSILLEPHIVPKLTIKTSSSDISGNAIVQSVIVPKLTIKMDSSGSISANSNTSNIVNRVDHGSSSSRSSSTSPSCSSRSSPSPTQERNNILKSEINTDNELPPLPKLTIKTSGDCVETIIAKNSTQQDQQQEQQHQQECHIVASELSPTIPKLTIKTYSKPSSSTIISSCSTPTLNAILTQTDGSVVPKLTIKPILSTNSDDSSEGVVPKLTIKANSNVGQHNNDSPATVYSSELHSVSAVSSKSNISGGNSGNIGGKEQHSIPKLTIRTKPVNSVTPLELATIDMENDDKVPKFSIKHTSHLDNSQTIPKLTIHVNEQSSGMYTTSSIGSNTCSNNSNNNSGERIVPKLKISLQDKISTVDNQHYYHHHSNTDEGAGNNSKTFPKIILKPPYNQSEQNLNTKQNSDEDKIIPKLTIINSGNQSSIMSENTESLNNSEKIPKIVIKQTPSATATTAAINNESLDEIDKLVPKIIVKDIQFCENENVPQFFDRSNPKVILKDIRLDKNRKDFAKLKNTNPANPLLEKKMRTQKIKGSLNKRVSPTMQFLNTDCLQSQDRNDICVSNNNCQSDLENNCDVIIHQNQLQPNEIQNENIIAVQGIAVNSSNRADQCIQHISDDVSVKSDEINQILGNQSQFSVIQNQQEQQPMETVDLTDTPSPGASPNPQYDGLNQDKYNMSKRLNNQLLYDILKSAKQDINTEKNRASNYAHILNGQHMENERNKIDDILMQNDITNDSNSFIVNHFQEDQNCIDSDVILQNNNTEIIKECQRSSSNSLKRKTEDLLYESGGNGDCTNEIPYKRTKDNLIGANQIIETSTTSLSSFEVCLKMTPANCLPNMNNITDTISLPDSESDNIMLCDTGTNSLDGTKFCTVTDFESIKSIDDDDDEVQIIQPENKQIASGGCIKHQQNDLQLSLQNNNVNINKIKEVVDLTDEIGCTKESSVIVPNTTKIKQRDQCNLIRETQFSLHVENLFSSQQSNLKPSILTANHSSQIENLLCTTTNQNIQEKINALLIQQSNDQDSNSIDVPSVNKSRVIPSIKRGRGRPRKIVTVEKDNNLKVRRRTQVSMMLEDALHSQVYKDRSPKINLDLENSINIDDNNRTNLISLSGSEFNINNNQDISDEIPIDNPQTPEKLCSQDDISQNPPIFATPLEFCSPKSPNNLFNESFESQGSDIIEEVTPSRRGRGRGRGSKNIGSARGRGSRGRGRGSRGSRGRPSITPRRPIGGLTHTPNPNLIRERHFSQENKARVLFDPLKPSSVQVFEEDTRMSADSSTVQRQSEFLNDENSQSSVLSSTSILDQSVSSVKKRSKLEVLDPDGKTEYPVERIAEYDWPPPKGCCPDRNRETYMIQEQIAEYLGIKSFKRKYPDLFRRQIDMEERNYLRDKGLVTEKMCDLGITAVLAYEVLDIMYLDFIEKYEEYKNYLRQKHLKEIETKQKSLSHNNVDKSLQTRDRALQSASKWNTHFNNERKEERKMCIDLQTYIINKPLPKNAAGTIACIGKIYRPNDNIVPKEPITSYPIALVPGQFGEGFKTYSAEELRSFPLNTVIESSILEIFKTPSVKVEPEETENKLENKIEIEEIKEIKEIKEINEPDIKDVKDIKPITDTTTISATKSTEITTLTTDSDNSSHASSSESDSDSDSASESSDEDFSPNDIKCTVCHLPQNKNLKCKPEVCIECYTCRKKAHPSCIEMSTNVLNRVLSYNWQCAECKCCIKCKRNVDRTKMLFCEQCDRAFHIYCIQIKTLPDKRWSCERCSICRRCGATDPSGNSPSLSSTSSSTLSKLMLSPNSQQQLKKNQRRSLKWINEYRTDHLTRLREHSNMLCIPCSKLKNLSFNVMDNNNSLSLLTATHFTKQTVQGITTKPTTILSPLSISSLSSSTVNTSSIMASAMTTTSVKNTGSSSLHNNNNNNNNNVSASNNSSAYIPTTIQSNS